MPNRLSALLPPMNDIMQRHARTVAILYILLLAVPFSLPYNIYICDILAFAMLAFLAYIHILARMQSDVWNYPSAPLPLPCPSSKPVPLPLPLFAYLAVAFLAMLNHACAHPTFSELYEWIVFAYLAFVFHFYSNVRYDSGRLAVCAAAILAAVFLSFIYEMLASIFGWRTLFCFVSEQMETTEMSFLSRRFAFTMHNPNVFACFYILPLSMLTPFVTQHDWNRHPLKLRLLYFPICLLLLLPLLSSASKHGLMSLAILTGWLPSIFCIRRKLPTALALFGILSVAAVFELTVLFTAFPLKAAFPFINTAPGMYSVHQGIYAKMLLSNPKQLACGMGITEVKAEYPKFADRQLVASVLERYNAMPSFENFITFMDAHCEYLNQTALFGVVALILLFAFLLSNATSHPPATLLFIAALLCCCLWDDLLSKRHVWIALAILSARRSPH